MGVNTRGPAHFRTAFVLACAALLSVGCDEEKPAERGATAPSAAAAALAGVLEGGPALDPPRPAGDLRADLDAFTTVEACAAKRASVDPLVGDALDAIGYETFLRDACRVLEAMKHEDVRRCEPIDASSLRARCRARVAMVARRPDDCPARSEAAPRLGRDPTCVAAALRSPALCAGEPRSRRAACEALVGRDGAKCAPLPPADKDRCEREAERWRNVLVGTTTVASVPPRAGELEVHGAAGRADPAETRVDLALEVESGGVLTTAAGEARFELGALGFSGVASKSVGPQVRTRVALALVLPVKGHPYVRRFELGVPGGVTLACDGPDAGTKVGSVPCALALTVDKLDRARAGAVELTLVGRVGAPPQAFDVRLHARSFVRDVVAVR